MVQALVEASKPHACVHMPLPAITTAVVLGGAVIYYLFGELGNTALHPCACILVLQQYTQTCNGKANVCKVVGLPLATVSHTTSSELTAV